MLPYAVRLNAWLYLAAVSVSLAALLVWCFFGSVQRLVPVCAVAKDGEWVCVIDQLNADGIEAGVAVQMENITGTVRKLDGTPLSHNEATHVLASDFIIDASDLGLWNVLVYLDMDYPPDEGDAYKATIVVDAQRPIDVFWK